MLLDGEAFEALYNMSVEDRKDWKNLKLGLLTVFGPARPQPGECYGRLFKLQKADDMSVQSYYNLICKKSSQLPNASEELKMEIFTNGLPKYIKFALKIDRPISLQDALEKAKSAEEMGPESDDTYTQLKEVKERLDNLERKLPSHEIALLENTKCFTRQKEGHIAIDCLENQGETQNRDKIDPDIFLGNFEN